MVEATDGVQNEEGNYYLERIMRLGRQRRPMREENKNFRELKC